MEEAKLKQLAIDWEQYCKEEYERWKAKNRLPFPYIWNPNAWFDRVEWRSNEWIQYIKERGDEWWGFYGYRLIWPDDKYGPLQLEEIIEVITEEEVVP